MALSKTMKILAIVVVAALVIIVVGLALGLCMPKTRKGVYLEYVPTSPNGTSLIYFKGRNQNSVKEWNGIIENFMSEYKHIGLHAADEDRGSIVNCDYKSYWPAPGQYCDVDVKTFYPCVSDNYYGYHKHTPCVFLTLNKVLNWTPQPYNNTEALPANMPIQVKDFITSLPQEKRNQIWLSCEGETAADKEYMGPMQYLPSRGFAAYYYPDRGVKGYLRPLVALHFERPQTGVVINIKCELWAKNIPLGGPDDEGSVQFQLMMD